MIHHEFVLEAAKIASDFVNKKFDLNHRVAEVAISRSLNAEQVKRLIEEVNKKVLLTLFEATGEQSFPVAEFEKVMAIVQPTEKVAFMTQEAMPIPSAYNQEKVASAVEAQYSDSFISLHENLLNKVASYLAKRLDQENLYSEMRASYGGTVENGALFKVAMANNDSRVDEFKKGIATLEISKAEMAKYASEFVDHPEFMQYNEAIVSGNFEKHAGMVDSLLYGNLNPLSKATRAMGAWHVAKDVAALPLNLIGYGAGKTVKGVVSGVGAAAVGGAKLAAKSAPLALAILPGRSLLDKAFMLPQIKHEATNVAHSVHGITTPRLIGSAVEDGMMKLSHEECRACAEGILQACAQFVPVNALEKHAGWRDGLQHLLDFVTPVATGGWGGIATTAAKKLGGGLALTMNSRQLQKSFDTVMQRNPDFKEKEQAIREYFHVIADNAPSLAKSPIVAESILKNFDALGTVDFNTIQAMRKTESEGNKGHGDSFLPIRL